MKYEMAGDQRFIIIIYYIWFILLINVLPLGLTDQSSVAEYPNVHVLTAKSLPDSRTVGIGMDASLC